MVHNTEETLEKENETVEVKEPILLVEESLRDKTLYAQEKPYGYQLVDSTPKVIMYLLSTSAQNVYMVQNTNAIVYKEDGFWYYSENNGKLSAPKILNIKF